MTIPNIATFDHGTYALSLFFPDHSDITSGTYPRPLCKLFVKEFQNHFWDFGIHGGGGMLQGVVGIFFDFCRS